MRATKPAARPRSNRDEQRSRQVFSPGARDAGGVDPRGGARARADPRPARRRARRRWRRIPRSPPPAPRRPCCRPSAARWTPPAGRLSRWTPASARRCTPRWSPERRRSPSSNQYSSLKFSRPVGRVPREPQVIQPLYTFGKIATRQEAAAHGLRAREAQTRMRAGRRRVRGGADLRGLPAGARRRPLPRRDDPLAGEHAWSRRRTGWPRSAASVTERDVLRLQSAHGAGHDRAQPGAGERGAGARRGWPPTSGCPPESRSPPPERSWSRSGASRRLRLAGGAGAAEAARADRASRGRDGAWMRWREARRRVPSRPVRAGLHLRGVHARAATGSRPAT